MRRTLYIILILISFQACIPLEEPSVVNNNTNQIKKVFTTKEKVYERQIKTVLCYPKTASTNKEQKLKPPIVPLGQTITIEFDDLNEDSDSYYAKIFHCNFDWKISNLNDIEFINDFNEIPFRKYQYSAGTKIPYVHYSLDLPKMKRSGNYVLMIYRDGDVEDIVLTKRFIVYENKVRVKPNVRVSTQNYNRDKNQQIDFDIIYNNYQLNMPREDVEVVLRQNYRWDKAIDSLKARSVREFDKKLEYIFFDGSNNFKALNEFRRFEIKSTRFLGFNVANIDIKDTVKIHINTDDIRSNRTYTRQPDINGGFLIEHYETQRGVVESDYIQVFFTLKSKQELKGEVYVIGSFNNWQTNAENLLTYNKKKKVYEGSVFIKQGSYNYMYATKKEGILDESIIEGTFQATENIYDMIIYHKKPLGERADRVIGYKVFDAP